MRFFLGIVTVALSAVSVMAANTCKVGGIAGTCISTTSCASSGGTSTAGYCPKDPNNVRCCTYGTCKAKDGRSGKCVSTSACSGTSIAGLCPGPSGIQCCVPKGTSCKVSDGRTGTCVSTSSCSGTSVPGYCPGASNIQCCVSGSSSSSGNLPGLNARQSGYARTIAKVAHTYGVGARGCAVAIATALVESSITVYCNYKVSGSCNLPHDAVGSDHLSVGIFQQQSPMWGTAKQCMDPATSAGLFYKALKGVSGWASMSIGTAAQRVQRSAYPDRYASRASEAVAICAKAY
ncbi:hypothetical protein BGX21_011569 [Mortierella sp. AD011]|nr:hypothetical protein BGX20_003466 [Mortierella sp. AD010]KAF9402010.1 hypothetical protein BGX21_011569 [Mortierella sp. AD011]